MSLVQSPGFRLLERSLDAASLRQNVISNNVANVDTPYFKRSDVRFEELLQSAMNGQIGLEGKRTDSRHFHIGTPSEPTPQVVTDQQSVMNNNQNNVDIDSEMTQLAKNQLRYNALVQQLNHDIRMTRTAIDGRR